MVTTWILAGSSGFLMVNAVVMQAIGATIGFAIVKRYGTSQNQVSLKEAAISLVLGIIGAYAGFNLFKDATFAADFVTNANSVAGAYFVCGTDGQLAVDRRGSGECVAEPRAVVGGRIVVLVTDRVCVKQSLFANTLKTEVCHAHHRYRSHHFQERGQQRLPPSGDMVVGWMNRNLQRMRSRRFRRTKAYLDTTLAVWAVTSMERFLQKSKRWSKTCSLEKTL